MKSGVENISSYSPTKNSLRCLIVLLSFFFFASPLSPHCFLFSSFNKLSGAGAKVLFSKGKLVEKMLAITLVKMH